jgi:hypothetical protein
VAQLSSTRWVSDEPHGSPDPHRGALERERSPPESPSEGLFRTSWFTKHPSTGTFSTVLPEKMPRHGSFWTRRREKMPSKGSQLSHEVQENAIDRQSDGPQRRLTPVDPVSAEPRGPSVDHRLLFLRASTHGHVHGHGAGHGHGAVHVHVHVHVHDRGAGCRSRVPGAGCRSRMPDTVTVAVAVAVAVSPWRKRTTCAGRAASSPALGRLRPSWAARRPRPPWGVSAPAGPRGVLARPGASPPQLACLLQGITPCSYTCGARDGPRLSGTTAPRVVSISILSRVMTVQWCVYRRNSPAWALRVCL